MYKIKKALLVFLCFAILGGMAACGENPDGASSTAGSEASSSAVSSEATSKQSSDVSAAAQGNVSTASQLTSSEEVKPLTLVKRDEESSWIVDFLCVVTKKSDKKYTVQDFPELDVIEVFPDFPDKGSHLLYLKTKSLEHIQKSCEALANRTDIAYATECYKSNDNRKFNFISTANANDGGAFRIDVIEVESNNFQKKYSLDDFPDIKLKSIEHLVDDDSRRSYVFYLQDFSLENTLLSIKKLKQYDGIIEVYLSAVEIMH